MSVKRLSKTRIGLVSIMVLVAAVAWTAASNAGAGEWAMNATVIEACSCPMFCPCYFGTKPAAHHAGHDAKHFCRFNIRLGGGKLGEIALRRNPGMTSAPVVIQNLRYFGAPRNDGFVLMPNEVEAYRVGPQAFEFKGTNGFMITLDIDAQDVAATTGTH